MDELLYLIAIAAGFAIAFIAFRDRRRRSQLGKEIEKESDEDSE